MSKGKKKPIEAPAAGLMRYYCPHCEGAIALEDVSDVPSVNGNGEWKRSVMMDCSHCNSQLMMTLRYNASSNVWQQVGTVTRLPGQK